MKPIVKPVKYSPEIEALLADAGLPVSDLPARKGLHWFGARLDGKLVGIVCIEAHAKVGLLRSLAVDAGLRKAGYGRALVAHAEAEAARLGIRELYLLTVTAASFFARLGYAQAPRADAPEAIAGTTQFAGLCPASSAFMHKPLGTLDSLRQPR